MRRRARDIVLVASAVLPLLVACGGGDDGAESGASVAPITATTVPAAPTTALAQQAPAAGLPLVIDTDLAADDIVALSYVTSRPDVDLLAVTVSGTGEVRCPRGADVARGLLARIGRDEVPVACGSSTPLAGTRAFPELWRNAADNAYGLLLEMVTPPADPPSAAELLAATIMSSPQPVVLLTLGPLTDVAEAIAEQPELLANVDRIVVMGGAVAVPGNVEPEGAAEPLAAEWNFYVDPTAAAAVVGSGVPVTLVGLDATNHVPVDEDVIKRLAANDTTDATRRVLQVLDLYPPPYLWDPLAAIAATDPALVPTHSAEITVATQGDDAGRTAASTGGSPVDVADPPNADVVIEHLLRTLAGVPANEELATPTTLPTLGEMTVRLDGTTCTYDGPTTLQPGVYRVTMEPGSVPYWVSVAFFVGDATSDDVVAWISEHPDEQQQPPMLDEVVTIGEGMLQSPASVVFRTGNAGVACVTEDNSVFVAADIVVNG